MGGKRILQWFKTRLVSSRRWFIRNINSKRLWFIRNKNSTRRWIIRNKNSTRRWIIRNKNSTRRWIIHNKNTCISTLRRTWGHLIYNFIIAWRVTRIFDNRDFNVVISHDSFALLAAWRLSRMCRSIFMYDIVEIPDLKLRSGKFFRKETSNLANLINNKIDSILIRKEKIRFANSPGHAHWHFKQYKLNKLPAVITNAGHYCTFNRSDQIRQDLKLNVNERLLLFIGSAEPGYGLDKLVRALAKMSSDIHLAVLGPVSKDYLSCMRILTLELGVQDRLHFLNTISRDSLPEYASGADIGIIALQTELINMQLSLSNRFFDYVMARLPILSSRLLSVLEYLEKYKIGLSIDDASPQAITNAIYTMLNQDKQEDFKKNLELAAKELCWEQESIKLIEMLETCCPKQNPIKVCIIARKNLQHNFRVSLICNTLVDHGHDVTLITPFETDSARFSSYVQRMIVDDGHTLFDKLTLAK